MSPNRIVIDTNVFISGLLSPERNARKAINIAINQFRILQSDETYQELETRICKKKFNKYLEINDRQDFLLEIKNQSLFITISYQTTICSDPDDNKFLELAVSGMARYIITGDRDLLILENHNDIPIVKPTTFLDLVKSDNDGV
jgi:uncharacterized protein